MNPVTAKVIVGHVLAELKRMPAESVHCVVTSPPYWGLRDYKLEPQVWDGDPACSHKWDAIDLSPEPNAGNWTQAENGPGLQSGRPQTRFRGDIDAAREGRSAWREIVTPAANGLVNNSMQGETLSGNSATRSPRTSAICERCGAWLGSLGLEPTPDLYVQHIVQVFREVRRVLRDDGVMFLNMGDCYYSDPSNGRGGGSTLQGGKPHLSGARRRVRPYDISGKVPAGSQENDCSLTHLCDECLGVFVSRNSHNDGQPALGSVFDSLCPNPAHMGSVPDHRAKRGFSSQIEQGRSSSATSDRKQDADHASAQHSDVQESTIGESSGLRRDECWHCDNCGTCLSVARSSTRDVRLCARKSDRMSGNSLRFRPSDGRADNGFGDEAYLDYSTVYRLKPKDLVGMPWRVAFALQADGWWLRSDIVWAKPNPMPESVTDRPTKAHEFLFLLTKSAQYFYDADAIREPAVYGYDDSFVRGWGIADEPRTAAEFNQNGRREEHRRKTIENPHAGGRRQAPEPGEPNAFHPFGRNKRTVWEIATEPFPEAHFATFPQMLVHPCILAGTSERGCCSQCGAPWERVTEVVGETQGTLGDHPRNVDRSGVYSQGGVGGQSPHTGLHQTGMVQFSNTVGWEPTCRCRQKTVPCTVLDPFCGSGTTLLVASKNGRSSIGIDLQEDYVRLILRRLEAMEGDLVHPTQVIVQRTEEASSCELTSTILPAD